MGIPDNASRRGLSAKMLGRVQGNGCKVSLHPPQLGFDLKIHTGYTVEVSGRELALLNSLNMMASVTREDRPDTSVVIEDRLQIPPEARSKRSPLSSRFFFDVDEGPYNVTWSLRDSDQPVCSAQWQLSGVLPQNVRDLAMRVNKGAPPAESAPARRRARVTLLASYSPSSGSAASISSETVATLKQLLKNISRDPGVERVSLVAFNIYHRKVVFRQDNAGDIDFDGLQNAVSWMKPGTIQYAQLVDPPPPEEEFVLNLVRTEQARTRTDAVILVGPYSQPCATTRKAPAESPIPAHVFQLLYGPSDSFWPDAVGRAVKRLGGTAFSISNPHDFVRAWEQILAALRRE